jgi:hypothetical protein
MKELEEKIKYGSEAEEKEDFLGACLHYKEALKIAKELNSSENIKNLKNKIVTLGKKIKLTELSVEQQVPNKEIDDVVNSIIRKEDDLQNAFFRIAHCSYLRPKMEHIVEQTKKTMPVSFQIANVTTFSNDGHILSGGEDPNILWLAKMYEISQGVISSLYIPRIFKILREDKGFNSKSLSEYIQNKNIFPDANFQIFDRGVERYFEGDYISALHILIPQFERAFLMISKGCGIDINVVNRGKEVSTRTQTLSENHLTSPEFKKVWGEDFCEQIKFVLFDVLGYKLRHRVAHGEIDERECNQTNVELILYFFIVLFGRVDIKQKN